MKRHVADSTIERIRIILVPHNETHGSDELPKPSCKTFHVQQLVIPQGHISHSEYRFRIDLPRSFPVIPEKQFLVIQDCSVVSSDKKIGFNRMIIETDRRSPHRPPAGMSNKDRDRIIK